MWDRDSTQMKALVLDRPGHLSYGDVPMVAPEADEILVEVRACGICGSDVHGMDGSTGRRIPPIVMGHEAAGIVAKLGSEVTGWSIGDRVTFDSTVYCGRCDYCRRGEINLCDSRRVLGVSCAEYRRHGAFAEYLVVPARIAYRIPDDLSFTRAAFAEPLSVAVHGVSRVSPAAGESGVVIGAGMVGLLVIQALRASGCAQIFAVDLDADRLALAAQFGAKPVRGDADAVAAAVFDATGGVGADFAIEVVGLPGAVESAVASVRKGGRVSLIGNLAPRVELALQAVVTRELALFGSCASVGDYPESIRLLATGAVDVDPLISVVAPLTEGAAWFEKLHAGSSGLLKVVLEPGRNEA